MSNLAVEALTRAVDNIKTHYYQATTPGQRQGLLDAQHIINNLLDDYDHPRTPAV